MIAAKNGIFFDTRGNFNELYKRYRLMGFSNEEQSDHVHF